MIGNSYQPFFLRRFETRNGQVILTGRFTMSWFTKVFTSFWFAFVVLWIVGTLQRSWYQGMYRSGGSQLLGSQC